MKKIMLKMNLQMFAEPGAGTEDGSCADGGKNGAGSAGGGHGGETGGGAAFDYEKLANIINGRQASTEDSVLNGYFKQQGLSKEEAAQAIAAFKAEKAKNTPDVGAMQAQVTQAQEALRAATVNQAATMAAVEIGLDAKTIPYVLKMADLSQVVGEDGKINQETLKNALNKVLEDIPALKPQAVGGSTGFQMGASNQNGGSGKSVEDTLDSIFGIKKK